MAEWHPDAIRVLGRSSGSAAAGAGPKILHHTTEGASAAGAIAAYRASGSWPTFTVEWDAGKLRIYQHMPLSSMARALENPPDAWETNRARCTQIEHVGFAGSTGTWPEARYIALAGFCRWIEAQTRTPRKTVPGTQWGVDRPPRLSGEAFHKSAGHLGHQHAPTSGTAHWDPGGGFRIALVIGGDPEITRQLRIGDLGADVLALQSSIRHIARNCAMAPPDFRRLDLDGHYGPMTDHAAMWASWLRGFGLKKASRKGPLGMERQRIIRYPERRSAAQLARSAQRRKSCSTGVH